MIFACVENTEESLYNRNIKKKEIWDGSNMEHNRYKEKVRLAIYNKDQERAEHFHQDIELLYVMEGGLDVTMGEQVVSMRPEDILVINANKKHSLNGTENVLFAQFTIEYHMVSDVFQTMNVIFWCDSTKGDNERYEKLRSVIKKLLNYHLSSGGNVANFGYIGLCYRVLDLLSGYFLVQTADKEKMDEQDKFDERIQQINNYIRANYNQPISLKELSEKLFLSNGYLSRFFKKNYGMNFAEYLTNIRLFHAVDDLLYTSTPITVIAYDNGFASVAVFNKAFKKAYGETPSQLRKKNKEQKADQQPQQNQSEIEARLEQFLMTNQKEQKEETPVKNMHHHHSVMETKHLKNYWGKTLNMGMAEDLLKSNIQEHIILLKEILNVEYIRICNPFTKGLLIDSDQEDEKYNFTKLDEILDFLTRHGLKPHIEMGPKPRMITYNVQNMLVEGGRDVDFQEPEKWKHLLHAMLRHLVHRYGSTEVNQWRMELWFNENKWDSEEGFEQYFQLFDILASTVREFSDQMAVGGCGIRADYQEDRRKSFYREWSQQRQQPDFFSLIVFPYDRGEEKQDHYSKRCTDNEGVMHRILTEKAFLTENGMGEIPLYITEWNLTISARNAMNDASFKGAYIIKNILDVYGQVGDMAYWIGSDCALEYYDSNELLFGGTGLLTKDGILKPACFAFEFLTRLYSQYIGKGSNYLISTDGHDSYGIICHNQRALGYNYYFTKEDEMDREHMWKYFEERDELELHIQLDDVANGNYQIKFYRIGEQSGSVMNIWQDMDFEPELSRNDIKYFRRMCEPKLAIQKQDVKEHMLKLHIPMVANEIVFVRVRRLV